MPRKRRRQKRKLAVLDFETNPFEHGSDITPFTGGVFTEDTGYQSWWGDDCNERVADFFKGRQDRCYAHNGGRFDFFFMLPWFKKEFFLINNRIAKCYIEDTVFLDSYLILPFPLSAYKKDEVDYGIFKPELRDIPENRKNIESYLQKDCEYLYEWVEKFIHRFGPKLTVGQTAFDQLSKSGYPSKRRSSKYYDERIRPFYHGGRTQVFKQGFIEGNVKVYDINSAYAFAMRDYHPFGTGTVTINKAKNLPKEGFYFAHISAISKGALLFKHKKLSSYPEDNEIREYKTTSWEIRAGLETGTLTVTEIHEVIIYDETRHFREYVDKFFDEKKHYSELGDKANTLFAKFLLVSGYGKFATDPCKYKKSVLCNWDELPFDEEEEEERESLALSIEEYINEKGWTLEGDTDFGKTFWSRPDPGDSYFNVAVAASITGWVRAYLWRALCKTTDKYYCDTDSIICRDFQGTVGKNIGEWDLEDEGYKGIYIGGKKLYAMELNYCAVRYEKGLVVTTPNEGEIKKAHKGSRLTFEEIVDIVKHGKTIHWENKAPSFSLSAGMRYIKRDIKMTGI